MKNKERICPVEKAGSLDTWIRKRLQNPRRILAPYITKGMTVLDFGCGPGFFTIEIAKIVGNSGQVYAVDLQEGMLRILEKKIRNSEIQHIVTLHQNDANSIGISEKVDFVLVFYVLHELPDQDRFFEELSDIVNPGGQVLIVEPPFHTAKYVFDEFIQSAEVYRFESVKGPKLLFNRTAILVRKN